MGAQLVILAAGLGRRFGGLKQLTPVGPGGEALMDYTVFDALRSGFDEIVLVIRREIEDEVRAHVEAGFGRRVSTKYVRQQMDGSPPGRTKPWGTGQAVLAAGAELKGPFGVANADDSYGAGAVAEVAAFLAGPATGTPTWAVSGYRVTDTLPAEGPVSRGLLRTDDGWLQAIDEVHSVRRHPAGACFDRDGETVILPASTLVSMNLWGFGTEVLAELEDGFRRFRASSPGADAEFYLPLGVGDALARGAARVKVLPAVGTWCGMTSAADLDGVRQRIGAEVAAGAYPASLWE